MKHGLTVGSRGILASVSFAILVTPAISADASFAVPRTELIAAIKTIGVMPVAVDGVVPNQGEVALRLEQDIVARLQRGGFTVVPPAAMRAIRERGQTTLGGLYDPMSGVQIRDRVAALEEFAQHEYRTLHPVDAILHANVVRRQATFDMGSADWDGVRERVTTETGITAALQGMLSAMGVHADVPALSLSVELVDSRGETLYTGFGGLMVLEYPTLSGTLVGYNFAGVEPDTAMGDSALTSRALSVAVDPLATGAIPAKRLSFTLPPPRQPPTSLTPKELLRDHRRLALASLEMSGPALEQRDRIQARYRELLAAKLKTLGFEVAGSDDFEPLWAAERADAGGFYDRFTGRPDAAKLNTARARVLATLHERYNVSALAIPSIVSRAARFGEGYAKWDEVVESVTGGGSVLFNKSIFNSSYSYAGDLDAVSLQLRIVDDTGRVLFEGMGGLQLTQLLDGGRIVSAPEPTLFADPASDARAVDIALRGLGPQPTKGR